MYETFTFLIFLEKETMEVNILLTFQVLWNLKSKEEIWGSCSIWFQLSHIGLGSSFI